MARNDTPLNTLTQSKYLRSIVRHFLIWTPAFTFWMLMREFGHEVIPPEGFFTLNLHQHVQMNIMVGTISGVLFGTVDYFFNKYIYRRFSFGKSILIGATTYLASIFLLVTITMRNFTKVIGVEWSWELYKNFVLSGQMILLTFYIFLVGFFIDFFREVNKKFGPGNLWKMMKGEFYNPKEEDRIFIFLDLKGSTTIAERLGHQQYSELIQWCFQDVTELVLQHKAHVYQYVGDEIVLSWNIADGLENLNCIQFFFNYQKLLQKRSKHYLETFGLVPEFKAGLEMGKVMVAEVGDLKRDIAYHGDVLNTASRIQDCCNAFDRKILISENLETAIDCISKDHFELMGDIQLRGKERQVKIYAVKEPAA